jgi:hypothetical protein
MEQLSPKQISDLRIVARFIMVYCHAHHDPALFAPVAMAEGLPSHLVNGLTLCPECADLLRHGIEKRATCPLDPKPTCKNCHIHCYSKSYREKIREIMAFSGRKMILRGRLDYLWHYFF